MHRFNDSKTTWKSDKEDWLQRSETIQKHKHQRNKNQQKTKMARKTTVTSHKAKKGKPEERNWISSNINTKQRHKDYVNARIDKTQQNSRCRLFGDKVEMINHIISECSKLAQKEYKTRHDWVGKVIHWELFKKFKFELANKWYIHNPESVQENEDVKIRGRVKTI